MLLLIPLFQKLCKYQLLVVSPNKRTSINDMCQLMDKLSVDDVFILKNKEHSGVNIAYSNLRL